MTVVATILIVLVALVVAAVVLAIAGKLPLPDPRHLDTDGVVMTFVVVGLGIGLIGIVSFVGFLIFLGTVPYWATLTTGQSAWGVLSMLATIGFVGSIAAANR